MNRAEAEVFSISNEELAEKLRGDLRIFQQPIRLSALPCSTARDIIRTMQAIEAVRNAHGNDLVARKLPRRLDNEFYSGTDYEINLKK